MAEITRKDFQLQMKTFGEMNQKLSTIEENTKPDTEAQSIKRGFLETIFERRQVDKSARRSDKAEEKRDTKSSLQFAQAQEPRKRTPEQVEDVVNVNAIQNSLIEDGNVKSQFLQNAQNELSLENQKLQNLQLEALRSPSPSIDRAIKEQKADIEKTNRKIEEMTQMITEEGEDIPLDQVIVNQADEQQTFLQKIGSFFGRDAASKQEEIQKDEASENKKDRTILSRIAGGIGAIQDFNVKQAKKLGGGIFNVLKGTLFAGLVFAAAAFFNSKSYQNMIDFIVDDLGPALKKFYDKFLKPVGDFFIKGIARVGKAFNRIFGDGDEEFNKKTGVDKFIAIFKEGGILAAAMIGLAAAFAPIAVGGALFKLGIASITGLLGGARKFFKFLNRRSKSLNTGLNNMAPLSPDLSGDDDKNKKKNQKNKKRPSKVPKGKGGLLRMILGGAADVLDVALSIAPTGLGFMLMSNPDASEKRRTEIAAKKLLGGEKLTGFEDFSSGMNRFGDDDALQGLTRGQLRRGEGINIRTQEMIESFAKTSAKAFANQFESNFRLMQEQALKKSAETQSSKTTVINAPADNSSRTSTTSYTSSVTHVVNSDLVARAAQGYFS